MIKFRNKLFARKKKGNPTIIALLNFSTNSGIELTEKLLNQKNLTLLIILRIAPITSRKHGKELERSLT